MMLAIEMTDETPIIIPRIVSAERIFDDRKVSSAARKFSRTCDGVMIAISPTSKRQWDRVGKHARRDRFQRKGPQQNLGTYLALLPSFERMREMAYMSAIGAPREIPRQCQSGLLPGIALHSLR